MEGQAVTTNPWLIMAINMTVVFVVLILLGILMTIVHLIDPTKKKKDVPPSAPVAAPAATAPSQDVVAVIVGALAAMGYSADQIAHIRPIVSYNWKMEGRLRGNR
ncbi:MAG: OadG family protein [Veillonella sp.]|uniref:methylmalonyl-CoA decarboxylase subunit epsilon n=1 Tax=Veillonella sp. TaxID=1926307 RepID=UPI00257FF957|nr:OadG family protein [Veillonella sp.]MBS6484492.1 OadG family protein [Veillonella sp.]